MTTLKKTSSALCCLLLIAQFTCVKVPEHCGDGYDLDPATEFCFENRTYKKCDGKSFDPMSEFCSGKAVYVKCDGNEYDPAKRACENGELKSIFTVFFNTSGGNPAEIQSVTVDSGTFLGSKFPNAPERYGYTFDGWFNGTQEYIASSVITKTMTLTANWTAIATYRVTYDGNGNTGGSAPIDTRSPYLKDSIVTVLGGGTLTRTNHIFNGWSVTADGTGPSYTEGNTFAITAHTTLYAKWIDATISTFTVNVESVGIGATGNGNYSAGETVEISAGNAVGLMFKQWTTASPGVILSNANSVITTFIMPANAVTVTAVFEELPKYTVTYNGNTHTGGTVPIDDKSPYYSGSTVTVLDKGTLTKTTHAFNGWSTGPSGSGKNYVAEDKFTISENTTLYAKWTDLSTPTYTVRVLSAGTGASGNGSYEAGATVNISAGTPPNGQRFKNWTSNDNITFNNANNATTTFTMPAKAVDVAANFELITYPVTVSSPGTGYSGTGNYAVGATVTVKAGTAPTGLQFNDWTSDDDIVFANPNSTTTTFIMPANPVTVTANFGPITYKVTVTSAGTGASGGGDYAYGTTVSINAGTAPAGKRFTNWTTSSNGVTFTDAKNAATTFTMPANAVTVTANFETIPTFTVTVTGGTGGGSYMVGETVTITAVATLSGQPFQNWTTTSNGVNLVDANSAITTFTMPANTVTVTAVFEAIFTDVRDNKKYKYVTIGGKMWMAENLNYDTASSIGSWCYENDPDMCTKYGRLYNFDTAIRACPLGWRLPMSTDWDALEKAVGTMAGRKLKSTSGWYNNGNGTDAYGFSALPGGYRDSKGIFYNAGYEGNWWTCTASYSGAYGRDIYDDDNNVYEYIYNYETAGLSVRCLRD